MADVEGINEKLAGFGIEDEENEELVFDDEVEEESNKFDFCLVDRFLTEKGINSRAMKTKLTDVWRPSRRSRRGSSYSSSTIRMISSGCIKEGHGALITLC